MPHRPTNWVACSSPRNNANSWTTRRPPATSQTKKRPDATSSSSTASCKRRAVTAPSGSMARHNLPNAATAKIHPSRLSQFRVNPAPFNSRSANHCCSKHPHPHLLQLLHQKTTIKRVAHHALLAHNSPHQTAAARRSVHRHAGHPDHGGSVFLVSALSKVSLQTARNEASSDLLSQAKEVVIGYALNNTGASQYPGELLYPDVLSETPPNYDGNTEGGCLDAAQANGLPPISSGANMRCLGRLPWKVFSMPIASPSENDPTGFMPWYAISANMIDIPIPFHFNSELLNSAPHPWLTVRDMKGNILSNRVAFIIFIPGAALPGQSRPASPNLSGANQYLDSITVPATCTAPCVPGTYNNYDMDDDFIMGDEHRWIDDPANPGKQIEDPNYHFNDKLIYVTIDDLMPLIEKRVAREVKSCLDNYAAATSANKYPWAAPISPLGYTSTTNTLFGRIPDSPIVIVTTSGPPTQLDASNATGDTKTMLDAMASLQTAVANCQNTYNTSNSAALASAGATLEQSANAVVNSQPTDPAIPSAVTTPAITAAQRAQSISSPTRCEKIYNKYHGIFPGSTSVQSNLASANTGLVGITTTVSSSTQEDSTMAPAWPFGCFTTGNMAGYWAEWKSLVLYQVSNNYRPQPTGTAATPCGVTGTCLSINGNGNPYAGSGTYRAAVIMAGKKLSSPNVAVTQTRATQSVPEYLEAPNTTASTSLLFQTYKPTDANYLNVNDLVLCLDGKTNCQ